MKFALLILVLLPLVYCQLFDPVSIPYKQPFDLTSELMSVVDKIVDNVGPNATEAECENECTALLHNNALLSNGCDLICKSLQSLVKQLHIV